MVKKKYTIILDTNILGDYKNGILKISDFNYFQTDKGVFESLIRFIQDNSLLKGTEIAVSKISIEEIKYHQNELFNNKKKKLVRLMSELSFISDNTSIKDLDYREHLSNKARAFLGVYGLKILDYPPDSCLKKLIERVLAHKDPFYKKKSDSGFKDALIWESVIQYAKENPDREYIFLTRDEDFSEDLIEEFKSETKSDIIIKSSVLEVKKILDEKANLKMQFNKMSKVYSDNFQIIEDETNRRFRNIVVNNENVEINRISLNKDLFDLEKLDNEEYHLIVGGNILYEGMAWGFNPLNGDVDWHIKQNVESNLFRIFLKKEDNSYKIISVKNSANNLS